MIDWVSHIILQQEWVIPNVKNGKYANSWICFNVLFSDVPVLEVVPRLRGNVNSASWLSHVGVTDSMCRWPVRKQINLWVFFTMVWWWSTHSVSNDKLVNVLVAKNTLNSQQNLGYIATSCMGYATNFACVRFFFFKLLMKALQLQCPFCHLWLYSYKLPVFVDLFIVIV